jgi:hypothetical protein
MTADDFSPQYTNPTANTFRYNSWYTPSGNPDDIVINWGPTYLVTFDSFRAKMGDSSSFYGDPRLQNAVLPAPDLHLLSDSPCIDASRASTELSRCETDYEGNPRLQGRKIDIGAYEVNTYPKIDR